MDGTGEDLPQGESLSRPRICRPPQPLAPRRTVGPRDSRSWRGHGSAGNDPVPLALGTQGLRVLWGTDGAPPREEARQTDPGLRGVPGGSSTAKKGRNVRTFPMALGCSMTAIIHVDQARGDLPSLGTPRSWSISRHEALCGGKGAEEKRRGGEGLADGPEQGEDLSCDRNEMLLRGDSDLSCRSSVDRIPSKHFRMVMGQRAW